MPLSTKLFALVCTVGAAGLVGCTHSASTPTTMPDMGAAPTTMPAAPVVVTPPPVAAPAKVMTHVLTKDQPYFPDMPAAGAAPAGMLRAGSKVLLLIPGADYSQVETDMGITYYTPTDGLKPLGK